MADTAPNNAGNEEEISGKSVNLESNEDTMTTEEIEQVSGNLPPQPPRSNKQYYRSGRRRRGSIFFPILLIVVGAALLMSNLGFLSNSIGNTLISLWPVLFIAWGLDAIWRGEGLTGAVFLLGLGVVFLLGNFGYLELNPWQVFLTIWPILLISIGFDIIISRHRNVWTSLIGLVLIVLLMVGALGLAGVGSPASAQIAGEKIEFSLQGAKSANVQILPSAGTLKLNTLLNSNSLLEGTVPESTANQKIIQEYSNDGNIANLSLRSSGVLIYSPSSNKPQSVWSLDLTPDIPVALKVGIGAGDSQLDLSAAQLSRFEYDLAAGSSNIILPQTGDFEADVDGAIGQIVIQIPDGMAVKLLLETGLTTLSISDSLERVDDKVYQSPGFDTAPNRIVLRIGLALGQVTVQEK